MIDPAIFFPPEIVARIAELVSEEPPAARLPVLLSLSSASRSWHLAVQKPLYRSIRLSSRAQASSFVASMSTKSARPASVEAVSLVPQAGAWCEMIALHCKNVRAVEYKDEGSIDMFPEMQPYPIFQFLAATTLSFAYVSSHYLLNFGFLPSITHLSLHALKRLAPPNLALIVPNITTLRVSASDIGGDSTFDAFAGLQHLPHLRHIHIRSPSTLMAFETLQSLALDPIPRLDVLEISPFQFPITDILPSPLYDSKIGVLRLQPSSLAERPRDGSEEPLLGLLKQVDLVRSVRQVAKVSLPMALEDLAAGEECARILASWEEEGVGVGFEGRWTWGEFDDSEME